MATAANQKVPTGGTDMKDVAALVGLLGGQRGTTTTTATSNAGDITALQQALSQLQGADYSAMLQSIFQQAGAQIPGMQAAYGRSVGARSYNNTAVQAALNELLKATTVAAQEQMAKQQLANQQTQVQAGQAIANATKGTQTTQTQTQKSGLDLQRAAALLALWQGIGQLTGGKKLTDMLPSMTGGAAGAGVTSTAPAVAAPVSGTVMASPAQTMTPMSAAPVTSGGGIGDMLSNMVRAMGNIVAYGSTTPPTLTPADVSSTKSYNLTSGAAAPRMSTEPASALYEMSLAPTDWNITGPSADTLLGIPQPARSIPDVPSYWNRPSFEIAYGD